MTGFGAAVAANARNGWKADISPLPFMRTQGERNRSADVRVETAKGPDHGQFTTADTREPDCPSAPFAYSSAGRDAAGATKHR